MSDWEGLQGYFGYGFRDQRWGPSQLDQRGNGHIRTAPPRAPRARRPDLPAAKNPDGTFKVQEVADRTPADRRAIAAALEFIRGFGAR